MDVSTNTSSSHKICNCFKISSQKTNSNDKTTKTALKEKPIILSNNNAFNDCWEFFKRCMTFSCCPFINITSSSVLQYFAPTSSSYSLNSFVDEIYAEKSGKFNRFKQRTFLKSILKGIEYIVTIRL